jgi:hypothetical protein
MCDKLIYEFILTIMITRHSQKFLYSFQIGTMPSVATKSEIWDQMQGTPSTSSLFLYWDYCSKILFIAVNLFQDYPNDRLAGQDP